MKRRWAMEVLMVAAAVFGSSLERTSLAHTASSVQDDQDRMKLVLAHDNTNFPLTGWHKTVECGACHVKGILGGTPLTCEACHWSRRQDDPYRLQLGTQCGDCHTPQSWARVLPGAFDHERDTGLRLEGRHSALDCSDCHDSRDLRSMIAACVQCHRDDFQNTASPDHQAAGFPTDCEVCHFSSAHWEGARFDHSSFPLSGPHRAVSCDSCHQNGRFSGTPTQCIGCHRADFEQATNPNHVQAGFPTDCVQCHDSGAPSWKGAAFDHDRPFELRGMHRSLDCAQCHRNGRFAGTPTDCVGCHRSDYDRTTNPNHQQAGFPTDCTSCHGSAATSWQDASFDHERSFPLKGMHRSADCTQCHPNGRFAGTPSECVDCHRPDYDRTTSPNHAVAGFGTDCVRCHGNGASTWLGASFNHDSLFPLQGAHRTLDCQACHSAGYNLPRDCNGCHSADYNATRDPDHARSGFPRTCDSCHFPTHTSWNQAVFQHSFPINSGKHAGFDCSDCHTGPSTQQFSCIDCHTHEKREMDDKHKNISGYAYRSLACYSCHPNGRG